MKSRILPTLFLTAYGAFLVKVLVFKDLPVIRIGHLMLNMGGTQEGVANFVPFKTIMLYVRHGGLIIGGINIVGNIALLVPFGFLAPFVFRAMSWKHTLVAAVVVPFCIEIAQTVLHVGIFDIDDVLLNGIGVMIGYGIYRIITPRLR